MIPVYEWPSVEALKRIAPVSIEERELLKDVEKIVSDVKIRGNQAVFEYTLRFDGCMLNEDTIRVSPEEIKEAYSLVSAEFLTALKKSRENILSFHQLQKQKDWFSQDENGSITGQIYRPLQRVGLYVPGGTANYPSSVLMTCLPAVVAGVKEIVMVTPPSQEGRIPPATLVAAYEAGVGEIYKIGGAQAVAALAYGTSSILPVDKIVGPGNIFVTLAKKLVFGIVGIDMLAGPSEILIIGDGSVEAGYAAADLLSQAEHDPRARAILLTDNQKWATEVASAVTKQLSQLPREEIARKSLENFGAVIVTKNLEEAFKIANKVAPEHLELLIKDPWPELIKIEHAGAVFMGPYSPEPLGDYWAGPNHVLPTGGSARFTSPLTVDDFCKRSSIIQYTQLGLTKAANEIQTLAATEKLTAHGAAVAIRVKGGKKG